jgi:uncharacterized protein (TIGR02757 family)
MNKDELRELLELKYRQYNRPSFIENDPVSIPHRFTTKEDIEIAGFLAATIAWGNRKSIIANASRLMGWMGDEPHQFILSHSAKDLKPFRQFTHRTFNGEDCVFFIRSLARIYRHKGGLEAVFSPAGDPADLKLRIVHFRKIFFGLQHPARTEKHISDPERGSSAKRLCMFLRWMVRKDKRGVDFGIWQKIKASDLMLPLDVHTGNVSRKLGLLKRKQTDWKAVEEVTAALREFDPSDPVKFDFALFGMGVSGELNIKINT